MQQAVVRCQPHGKVLTGGSTLAEITAARPDTSNPDEAVVLHAIRAAHALGGSMTATLDAAAALLRERAVIRSEATMFSAQARLSARVLTGVPLAFAAWSAASSRSFRAALVSPIGLASALLGGACNLVGWWWMRRIVNKAIT
jgi:tight adherence protein B